MISIQMNRDDMDKVRYMLDGVKNAAPRVMMRAINETLGGVKTDASTEIRAIITASKSAVDSTFRTVSATVLQLSGLFESKGTPLPLIEFSANQTKAGVSVRVLKASPREVIPGTFIATIKGSGHKGVFWREWHATKGPVKKISYAKLPRKYRLPIKQLFGPRISDYLGDKGPIMANVLTKAEERLHKNLDDQLNYELSKL